MVNFLGCLKGGEKSPSLFVLAEKVRVQIDLLANML